MKENDISYIIRGAIFSIYKTLGPGLLESVYELALGHELRQAGCVVETQVPVPVWYKDVRLEGGFRLDMLVNGMVIIEIKSVETVLEVHHKQVLTYLKLKNKKLGILINFNSPDIGAAIFRKANNL